jgi:hypothetical protein
MEEKTTETQAKSLNRRQGVLKVVIAIAVIVLNLVLYNQLKDFGAQLYHLFN